MSSASKDYCKAYILLGDAFIESRDKHRILFLLDFKKEIFKGVLDDGGEDRVMLEGFLQSVKAMLDVNLEDPDEQETFDVADELTHRLVAETYAPYQKGHQKDQPDRSQDHDQEKDSVSLDENVKHGILSGFRNKYKRLINRF